MVEGARLVDAAESGVCGRRQVCGHQNSWVPLLRGALECTSCSPPSIQQFQLPCVFLGRPSDTDV